MIINLCLPVHRLGLQPCIWYGPNLTALNELASCLLICAESNDEAIDQQHAAELAIACLLQASGVMCSIQSWGWLQEWRP